MRVNKILTILIIISTLVIITSCNKVSNNLEVTREDNSIILDYLDNKTNGIAAAQNGNMVSAFKLLGTSSDKIYIWVVKAECYKADGILQSSKIAVSAPVVLYCSKKDKLIIKDYKSPRDGTYYEKDYKKLFPQDINLPTYEDKKELENIVQKRANEILN